MIKTSNNNDNNNIRMIIIKYTNNNMKYIVPWKVWDLSEDTWKIVNIFTLYK